MVKGALPIVEGRLSGYGRGGGKKKAPKLSRAFSRYLNAKGVYLLGGV